MALKGPDDKDVQKIHAQINQIDNQRFTLTTVAIAAFGTILAWIIPKGTPTGEVGSLTFIGVILLLLVLSALFLLSHLLKTMLRTYTTYLEVTVASGWESDWSTYRKSGRYLGYTKPLNMFFLFLGGVAIAYPCILAKSFHLSLTPIPMLWAYVIFAVFYLVTVILLGFSGKFDSEDKMKQKWEALKASKLP